MTAISSTDADFMVKVIDVYPEKFEYSKTARSYLKSDYPMSGYQLMIRGELFRGRFRKGFDNPLPFKPEEITPVNYTLYDVAHTFLPGHRLMIQIQSSWFPIIDRNPQRFIDTYHCTVEDFVMKQKDQNLSSARSCKQSYTTCGKKKKGSIQTSSNVIQ